MQQQYGGDAQVLLTNLQSLLPSQINAVSTFEGKLKNKVILTKTDDTNDKTNSNNNTNTEKAAYNGDDEIDDIFTKIKATKKNKNEKNGSCGVIPTSQLNETNNPFTQHKKMTNRQRKKKQLHKFNSNCGLEFVELLPTMHLFQSYMTQLIGIHNTNIGSIEENLLRIDLHGAPLSVVKSINPSIVGQFGLVLKESYKQLIILTPTNKILTVPKRGTIFQLDLSFLYPKSGHAREQTNPDPLNTNTSQLLSPPPPPPPPPPPSSHSFALLYGDQLLIRPYERVSKKFKINSTIELK